MEQPEGDDEQFYAVVYCSSFCRILIFIQLVSTFGLFLHSTKKKTNLTKESLTLTHHKVQSARSGPGAEP